MKHIILFIVTFFFTACVSNNKNECNQTIIDSFAKTCSGVVETNVGYLYFRKYNASELQNILVIESNAYVTDTVIYSITDGSYSNEECEFRLHLKSKLNTLASYEVHVADLQTFHLDSLTMVLRPQFSGNEEDYGCVLGSYVLDGEKIEEYTVVFTNSLPVELNLSK